MPNTQAGCTARHKAKKRIALIFVPLIKRSRGSDATYYACPAPNPGFNRMDRTTGCIII